LIFLCLQEVHHFLKDLTEAMGKDVKFIVDRVYEGRESSIAVQWHLGDHQNPPFSLSIIVIPAFN